MMRLDLVQFSSMPFPHGQAVKVFDPKVYADLIDNWPSESVFKTLTGAYRKLSLSERCNPTTYSANVTLNRYWREFHAYVKGPSFVDSVLWALDQHGVMFPGGDDTSRFTSRFEFSSLPSDGGAIAPHRDIPSKILTIVVPMTLEAVPGWGTDILEPLTEYCPLHYAGIGRTCTSCQWKWKDYETPRDAFRTVASFDYAPNTCGIFVKTADSWHAIGPLKGPAGGWRRSLTINVERAS
jgi:hypothetical protein